ncbi:hypothetical protein IJJ37_02230 [Candidatus Saccharibacteria bacterium]|nr:hypothetical protein [Candidatus Saccharibacteria bacterium]
MLVSLIDGVIKPINNSGVCPPALEEKPGQARDITPIDADAAHEESIGNGEDDNEKKSAAPLWGCADECTAEQQTTKAHHFA